MLVSISEKEKKNQKICLQAFWFFKLATMDNKLFGDYAILA
jgi:hypothetical protein